MKPILFLMATLASCTLMGVPVAYASDSHEHHTDDQHEPHTESSQITAAMALANNITTQIAGPGEIHQSLRVYARLVLPPQQEVQLSGRFPGLITRVFVAPGDSVTKGQVLARIESNESLSNYDVKAPISGVVSDTHAAAGNLARDVPLFVLTDTSGLWLEIPIFPSQKAMISQGQSVRVPAYNVVSQIDAVAPPAHNQPNWRARARLNNHQGNLTPGAVVQTDIITQSLQAGVRVTNSALQTYEGDTVVFVREDDNYHARTVTTGASDPHFTEILSGLHAGEEYVADNSYLIKADLGKSGAAHQH